MATIFTETFNLPDDEEKFLYELVKGMGADATALKLGWSSQHLKGVVLKLRGMDYLWGAESDEGATDPLNAQPTRKAREYLRRRGYDVPV